MDIRNLRRRHAFRCSAVPLPWAGRARLLPRNRPSRPRSWSTIPAARWAPPCARPSSTASRRSTASASSRRARPTSASCAPWSNPATSNGTSPRSAARTRSVPRKIEPGREDRRQDRRPLEVSREGALALRLRLVGLHHHHRLPHRRLQRRHAAQELGRLVGRQEIPRRALDARPSDRQSRVRADRRRRAEDKLYPIDFDRAFKKLDQIKPHVTVWWSTGQQPAQLLLDKEVVLATGWNGRFYDLIKKGAPIEIEWNEGALKQGSFVIPRGAKDPYWARRCWPRCRCRSSRRSMPASSAIRA